MVCRIIVLVSLLLIAAFLRLVCVVCPQEVLQEYTENQTYLRALASRSFDLREFKRFVRIPFCLLSIDACDREPMWQPNSKKKQYDTTIHMSWKV
jgi:hypothetical protein